MAKTTIRVADEDVETGNTYDKYASKNPVERKLMDGFFGALDELWQEFTPGRSGGDLYDWIADALGATVGAALTLVPWCRRRCPPKPATRSPAR